MTHPSTLLVLATLLLAACTRPAPPAPAAPPSMSLGGATLAVPRGWVPSPDDQLERLRAAGGRRDPGAEVEVVGRSVPSGSPAPGLQLMTVRQTEAYSEGVTAEAAAITSAETIREALVARGLAVDADATCAERHCDARWTIEGNGLQQRSLTRFWRVDARLHQVACTCTAEGCDDFDCRLPMPPGDAELAR